MAGIRCPKCGKLHPVRKLSGLYHTASIVRIRVVEKSSPRDRASEPDMVETVQSVPVQAIAPPKKPFAPASQNEYLRNLLSKAFPAAAATVLPFVGISLIWIGLGVFLFLFPIAGSGSYAARLLALFRSSDTTWGQPALAAGMSFILVSLVGAGIVRLITRGIPILQHSYHLQPDPDANARYIKSINRWHKLFYCRKCNHLFFPGSQNVMQMQPGLVQEILANEVEIENFLPRRSKVHFPSCPSCHMRDAVENSLMLSHTATESVGERAYSFVAEKLGKHAPQISRIFWVVSTLVLLVFFAQAVVWIYSVWAYHALYGGSDFVQYTLQRIQSQPITLVAYIALIFSFLLSIFYAIGIVKRLAWLGKYYCGRCDLTFIPGVWNSPFTRIS